MPALTFSVGFDVSVDWRVAGFAAATTLATALLFGLVPGLQASRPDVAGTLKSQGDTTGSGRRVGLRGLLVIGQIAGSLVLLIGGGLFLKSLSRARTTDTGLARDHRLLVSVNPSIQGYESARGARLYRELVARVRQLPGVTSAALAFPLPLNTHGHSEAVFAGDRVAGGGRETVDIPESAIDPDYFRTVGTAMVEGRDFTPADSAGSRGVVIVNQTMARRFWPGSSAVGKQLRLDRADGEPLEVVGVARDGKYSSLGEPAKPYMYRPLAQHYRSWATLVVLSRGEPVQMIPGVREAIRSLDPGLPVFGVMTMDRHLDNALNLPLTSAYLSTAFGLVALVLAVVGIYGTVSYTTARRTREVGIRIALGATAHDVLGLVLGGGIKLAAVGVVSGLGLALIASRLLRNLLYDVSPTDPAVFLSLPVLLVGVVVIATYLPARKATRVSPTTALRSE